MTDKAPVGPFGLNLASPQARGLIRWYPFTKVIGGGLNVLTNEFLTNNGSVGWESRANFGLNPLVGAVDGTYLSGEDEFRNEVGDQLTVTFFGSIEKRDTASSEVFLANCDPVGAGYNWLFTMLQNSDVVECFLKTSASGTQFDTPTVPVTGAAAVNTGHIALRYDGANLTAFFNGVGGSPQAKTGDVDTTDLDISFGRWNNSVDNQGMSWPADVRIYDRALNDDEIYQMQTTKSLYDLYWQRSLKTYFFDTSLPTVGGNPLASSLMLSGVGF